MSNYLKYLDEFQDGDAVLLETPLRIKKTNFYVVIFEGWRMEIRDGFGKVHEIYTARLAGVLSCCPNSMHFRFPSQASWLAYMIRLCMDREDIVDG